MCRAPISESFLGAYLKKSWMHLPENSWMHLPWVRAGQPMGVPQFYNHHDNDGHQLIHEYAKDNDVKGLKFLVERVGVCPNSTDGMGRTPLHLCCARRGGQSSKSLEAIEFLLRAGADPDTPDGNNEPPIITALRYKRTNVCKALLRAGADPRSSSQKEGWMGVHFAAVHCNRRLFQLFVDHGGSPEDRSKEGLTAMELNPDLGRRRKRRRRLN